MKEEIKVKINGLLHYLIIKRDSSRNITQIFEKPDLTEMPSVNISVEHIIPGSPEFNHLDIYVSGLPMDKEYKKLRSKYSVSGTEWKVEDRWNHPASFAILV